MSRRHHEYLDVYCCLSHEYFVAYPQPRSSFCYPQMKKSKYQNRNALERISSSSSSRVFQYKQRNLFSHTSERRLINKIMSRKASDHQMEFYMRNVLTKSNDRLQMADGDKTMKNIIENVLGQFRQQTFSDDESIQLVSSKLTAKNRSKKLADIKSVKDPISRQSSNRINQPLNRISTWRKLQANTTASHYDPIEQFQREQQHPLMSIPRSVISSPLTKQSKIDKSQPTKSTSSIINSSMSSGSLSIDSSTNLTDSNSNHSNVPHLLTTSLKTVDQSENPTRENDSFTNISPPNSLKTPSLHEIENIEEFQPVIELVSPSTVPSILLNDILSSFFPTLSTSLSNSNPDRKNTANLTELLLIGQPSKFISEQEQQQSKQVRSLSESIEELCLLIRKLLHYELTEQKITSLQATIANHLAILLTYLTVPNQQNDARTKNTIEKMTSTDKDDLLFRKSLLLTIETQTDPIDDFIPTEVHKSSSLDDKQPQKETSHTELISTSVSLHLPGRRLNHALSDTYIYHIHRHQQYSSSHHQIISFSDTTIHSFMRRSLTKEKTTHLLQRLGQKFQHYIELESSNTCLEASTEFTPDFLLTTINNSKYDEDDQTEQFGIDTEKQDCQTDTIPLIIDKNQELAFNSTEKENCDSLDQSNQCFDDEFNIKEDELPKSSISEDHFLFLNNTSSLSLDDVSPVITQLDKDKYSCHLPESRWNSSRWQVPILPRKTNSIDVIYEKHMAKIDFKYVKIRSNSHNGIHLIGKQVRIKSNLSTPTIKLHPSQEPSRKLFALNYNNNCNESDNSRQSFGLLSSTSDDTSSSVDTDTLDKTSADLRFSIDHQNSAEGIHSRLSHLSDVTDKLDSNIAMAEILLSMLNSFNDHSKKDSSTMKIDVLHTHIRQFLIDFDTRIHLGRKTNIRKRHTFPLP